MKVTIVKMAMMGLLYVSLSTYSSAQAPMVPIEEGGKKPDKIAKASVPKAVADTFATEYPVVMYEEWYSYPQFTDTTGWYGYSPYTTASSGPVEYYIVEFTKDDTPHKAIYSKSGKKIATHKKMKSDVPKAVSNAFAKSSYKDWTLLSEKEEMTRETDKSNAAKAKVYKLNVEKGKEKHALFFDTNGKLVKDKKIKTTM